MSLAKETVRRAENEEQLTKHSPDKKDKTVKPKWGYVFKRSFNEFLADGCTDLAAALTYFAVLSIFPALLAVVSLLGVFGQGQQTTQAILDFIRSFAPQDVLTLVKDPITQLTTSSAAGLALITGILGALWTASGYVGAFGRALNKIYDVVEGRPLIKLRLWNLLVTAILVLIVVVMVAVLILSGGVVNMISGAIPGVDLSGFATIWNWLRWPIALVLAIVLIALLYYGTPNVKQPKLRWISPGAAFSLVGMAVAGLGFTFYVSNFGKYNATYGTIGGVIVLLLFIWIMNNVLLFGAQIDSEIERSRELKAGIPAEESVQLPPRSEVQAQKMIDTREKLVEEARDIRLEHSGLDYSEDNGSGEDSLVASKKAPKK